MSAESCPGVKNDRNSDFFIISGMWGESCENPVLSGYCSDKIFHSFTDMVQRSSYSDIASLGTLGSNKKQEYCNFKISSDRPICWSVKQWHPQYIALNTTTLCTVLLLQNSQENCMLIINLNNTFYSNLTQNKFFILSNKLVCTLNCSPVNLLLYKLICTKL